ncbi:efflux RND transporter periplasmic adaptor subunit [Litorilituus lipolyticus]|uniref:Efflux RND transporter periplasmic adaptor subunit n=1 Tax=Litorilituus lipolyticus TaxID=2491017 RepID=A0A502L3S9_9GAMM|nr:efflux RND transporter periplasmic adaptor subunit [Litorilituus lipolyticus]TPH18512.1 efflux RND transporter periplasmic adaptor subunit [Litorilituus lipolyticus]
MNNKFQHIQLKYLIIAFALGALVFGALIPIGSSFIKASDDSSESSEKNEAEKPLYWVAPMDANYRRDEPGKSPMGMDLVPVYQDSSSSIDEGVGTIRISADVVNNLGVRTATVKKDILNNEIKTVGYVTYDEDKLHHIHPRVDGWIEKLYVKTTGAMVTKGQPLYDIYSPQLVNAQEELLLALSRNNQRLITAAKNRLVALQLPKSAIEEIQRFKNVKQSITFYAPHNGVVENLNIREGFYVKPGATLMSIGDLSQVWLEAEVFERQATQVHQGSPVTLTMDYLPGKAFLGEVDYVYPVLAKQTRTIKVRIRLDNRHGQFKPNMFAQVVIHASDNQERLVIPKEALIRTGNQSRVVLALGDGHFKSVEVSSGRFDQYFVEILSGLYEGDDVVTSAQFLLDSESSKSSDFMRLHHSVKSQEDRESEPASKAETSGVINVLMPQHNMANISREAIAKWNRPAATMDFIFAESIDLNELQVGDNIDFSFEIRDGDFVITHFSLSVKQE